MMTRSNRHLLAVLFAATIGCQAGANDGPELIAVENNASGITQVEIQHGTEFGERMLTVRGLDDSEQQLAIVTLRTGKVLYSFEPEVAAPVWSDGTELAAVMGDVRFVSVTPDREPHSAGLPERSDLSSFLRLRVVAAAIKDESGIWFTQPAPSSNEVAFAATACTSSRFPSNVAAALQCCQEYVNTTWHKIGVMGANYGKVLKRDYDQAACRTSSGGTMCGNSANSPGGQCTYGPSGAKNGSLYGTTTGTSTATTAVVYHQSGDQVCGVDSNGSAGGGYVTGGQTYYNQTLYAGVTGTNTNTSCCYNSSTGVSVPTVGACPSDTTPTCYFNSDCSTNICEYGTCVTQRTQTCSAAGASSYDWDCQTLNCCGTCTYDPVSARSTCS